MDQVTRLQSQVASRRSQSSVTLSPCHLVTLSPCLSLSAACALCTGRARSGGQQPHQRAPAGPRWPALDLLGVHQDGAGVVGQQLVRESRRDGVLPEVEPHPTLSDQARRGDRGAGVVQLGEQGSGSRVRQGEPLDHRHGAWLRRAI